VSFESQRVLLTEKLSRAKLLLAIDVKIENKNFDIPKNTSYGEFHIINGDPVTIGSEGSTPDGKYVKKRVRYDAMVQLTIWTPEGAGAKPGTTAGDKFALSFENKQWRDSEGDIYRFSDAQRYTPSTKNGWSVAVYRVPFQRDTIKLVAAGFDD
jgi:hypothetical protein